jgi:MoxR-like ATPase
MSQLSGQFPQLDLDMVPPEDSSSTGRETSVFDLESIKSAAAERGLMLDDPVYAAVLAALNAGKHVILTGPPGTAKTTLAETIAKVAVQSELAAGYVLTTATADWTTYDTIGGLRPDREHVLAFAPGHFIEAIEADDWLIIDELNRSNFDRAFGQLFTVLSGQAVTLPHERQVGSGRLVIAPGDYPNLPGDIIRVPSTWRVIATMNVFDKSLLFEMSFALMRRFAFIEVPSPSLATFHTLIDNAAGGDGDAAMSQLAADVEVAAACRRLLDPGARCFWSCSGVTADRTRTRQVAGRAGRAAAGRAAQFSRFRVCGRAHYMAHER